MKFVAQAALMLAIIQFAIIGAAIAGMAALGIAGIGHFRLYYGPQDVQLVPLPPPEVSRRGTVAAAAQEQQP